MIKIVFLALVFSIIFISCGATPLSCGEFGKKLDNDKCLCAAFTDPTNNNENCASGSGVCALPVVSSIAANERYTLNLKARRLNFEGDNLVIEIEYPSIPTGLTDIAVFSKSGSVLSSLQDYLAASTLGSWSYFTDSSRTLCYQVVRWTVDWRTLAPLVVSNEKGHFNFDITATTHIVREKSNIQIRSTQVAPSVLVDVVPITINLNQLVTTSDFQERVELVLDYDVKVKYYLKKVHLDPTTLKMRVVLQHNISFPLSLKSDNLRVAINGEVIPSRSYEKENKYDCPAKKGSTCQSTTVIIFILPFQANCTEYKLTIDVDLATKCEGTNDHTSKFLCYGLRKSLSAKQVPVHIPIKYSFCPNIQTTEVSVSSFVLTQNSAVLANDEILLRDDPLDGSIILHIDKIFAGSVFTLAKISSIKIYEFNSSNYYDVVDSSSLVNGELISDTQIKISFTYNPSYQEITTHLQNWEDGLYFTVTIDVSFYSPQGLVKKSVAESYFQSAVRAQVPYKSQNYLKRDLVLATSSNLKLDAQQVEKAKKEHELVIMKIKADKISQQLKAVQSDNKKMFILTGASVGACIIAAIVAIVLTLYSRRKSTL